MYQLGRFHSSLCAVGFYNKIEPAFVKCLDLFQKCIRCIVLSICLPYSPVQFTLLSGPLASIWTDLILNLISQLTHLI